MSQFYTRASTSDSTEPNPPHHLTTRPLTRRSPACNTHIRQCFAGSELTPVSRSGSGLALRGIGRAVLAPDTHHLTVETKFHQHGLFILYLVNHLCSPSDCSRNNLKIAEVPRLSVNISNLFLVYYPTLNIPHVSGIIRLSGKYP